ncbi:hypothetical protein D3C85_1552920 [compost metagenome]
MLDRRIGEDPHQPGHQQGGAEAHHLHADLLAIALGVADQRHAPDPQPHFDEEQHHEQVHQGEAEFLQLFDVGRTAPVPLTVTAGAAVEQADDRHRHHRQHRAEQGTAQGDAAVGGGHEGGEERSPHQQ